MDTQAILEKVKMLLSAVGVEVPEDDVVLSFVLDAVVSEILNRTNQAEVPEGLYTVLVMRTAGVYLRNLKSAGKLSVEFEAAVKSISEGDASVTFSDSDSPEAQFDALVSGWASYGDDQLNRYRRLVW